MSPDAPNRKMEELLRRHAEKRRSQGDGFPLHPATRRLLQAEVGRQFGRAGTDRKPAPSFFAALRAWRAAATAFGALVVLAAGLWIFSRHQPAALEKSDATYAKLESTREPAPSTLPEDAVTRDKQLERDNRDSGALMKKSGPAVRASRDENGLAATPPPLAAPTPMPALKAKDELAVSEKQVALNEKPASSLSPASPPARRMDSPKADFEQAAISAKEQQVAAVNTANNVAMKSAGNTLNSQTTYNGGAQNQALNAQAPSAAAPALGNAGLGGNQQQIAGGLIDNTQMRQQIPQPLIVSGGTQAAAPGQNAYASAPSAAAATAPQESKAFYETTANRGLIESAQQNGTPLNPATGVLTRFVVEQRGNSLRVIDSDQSVYDGSLSNEWALADSVSEPASAPVQLKRETLSGPAAPRFFRALGTNRSSGQLVVFDGQLPPSAAPQAQQTFVLLPAVDERRSRVAAQAISATARVPSVSSSQLARVATDANQTNAVLEGAVRVGKGAPQQLRAIRVQP